MRHKEDWPSFNENYIEDGHQRLCEVIEDSRVYKEDIEIFAWPQTWGSTSCGHGGIAGQALTRAQTVIVMCGHYAAVVVYIAGRHAYTIRRPNDVFKEHSRNNRLIGAHAYRELGGDFYG